MIRFRYIGDGRAEAHGRHDLEQCKELTFGEVLEAEPVKPRSNAHERFWFSVVARGWENLPDEQRARFPEPEALRKFLLVKAGWCDAREFVTDSPKAAAAVAAGLQWAEPYGVVVIRGDVVFAYVARSQKRSVMARAEFSEVTDRALHALSAILGCDPVALLESEAA